MDKKVERCDSTLEGDRCELVAGHHGKHRSNHDKDGNLQWVAWTDAGLARKRTATTESFEVDWLTGQKAGRDVNSN